MKVGNFNSVANSSHMTISYGIGQERHREAAPPQVTAPPMVTATKEAESLDQRSKGARFPVQEESGKNQVGA
jgi:hypothetical protein